MAEGKLKVSVKCSSIRDLRLITEKEKELAKSVWKEVEMDYVTYGRNVFKLLFSTYPTYRGFFLDSLGTTDVDPFTNTKFQKHMLQVLMPTLGGLIYNLDHPEAVHEAMKRLGFAHKIKELGLRRENIDVMCETVLNTLKQNLKTYTEEQEMAVSKILTMVINIFSNGLEGKTL